jgi:hypothetical protein
MSIIQQKIGKFGITTIRLNKIAKQSDLYNTTGSPDLHNIRKRDFPFYELQMQQQSYLVPAHKATVKQKTSAFSK